MYMDFVKWDIFNQSLSLHHLLVKIRYIKNTSKELKSFYVGKGDCHDSTHESNDCFWNKA